MDLQTTETAKQAAVVAPAAGAAVAAVATAVPSDDEFDFIDDEVMTMSVVHNPRFTSVKECLESIVDGEGNFPRYVENERRSFDELFNTHDGEFYIMGIQVAEGTFVVLENNGYFVSMSPNPQSLTQPMENEPTSLVSWYWSVNADTCFTIAADGHLLCNEELWDDVSLRAIVDTTHIDKWPFPPEALDFKLENETCMTSGLNLIKELTKVKLKQEWIKSTKHEYAVYASKKQPPTSTDRMALQTLAHDDSP